MTLSMTDDEWNAFALGLEQTLTAHATQLAEQAQKIAALEAWVCRRPGDAIPQPFIDQITADAIASVTPVDPEPEVPTDPESPVDEGTP